MTSHLVVPEFLLRRFADSTDRVMMERRDRNRRRTATVAEAARAAGAWTISVGAVDTPGDGRTPDLARVLSEIEAGAAGVLDRIVAGEFPPPGRQPALAALLVAFLLLVGRAQRTTLRQTAALLSEVIGTNLPEEEEGDESEGDELAEPDSAESPDFPELEVARADDAGEDSGSPRVDVSRGPDVARLLAGRTWQLVRFPRPQLLTGDTPVALWRAPSGGPGLPLGLGTADEVRFPLDPRHALILARRAPAGEVIRDLGDRHAAALNRTIAEAAGEWMYYHPDSDPLEAVALTPP